MTTDWEKRGWHTDPEVMKIANSLGVRPEDLAAFLAFKNDHPEALKAILAHDAEDDTP